MKQAIFLCLVGVLLAACAPATPTSLPVVPTAEPTSIPIPVPTSTPMPTPVPTLAYDRDIPGWDLVWADEFDGNAIDRANWTFDIGANGWGNAELEYYTDRPENARLENGMLVIEARQESFQGSEYTSARLKSQGLREFQYGRIEARIHLPSGQGIWPAFWMLGSEIGKTEDWPACGEIDVMEFIGKMPNTVYATVHGLGYSGANGIGSRGTFPEESLKNDFHVYAIEWEENTISWFVDDQQIFALTSDQIPSGTEWAFDRPFFILLNLAVGGNWPGYPDATTVFPQQFLVDYVRVYQRSAGEGKLE